MTDPDGLLPEAIRRVLASSDGQDWPRNLSRLGPEHKGLIRHVNAKLHTLQPNGALWIWAPGGQPLTVHHLAPNLLSIANDRGIESGLEWLGRVYRPQRVDLTVCVAVIGMEPAAEFQLANGVRVIPVRSFWRSSALEWVIDQQRRALLGHGKVRAVAVATCPDFPYIVERDRDIKKRDRDAAKTSARFNNVENEIFRTIEAFTMAGPSSPTGSWCWSEVSDPELAVIELPGFSHRATEGGVQYRSSQSVSEQDAELVSRYLTIEGAFARTLQIAMNRLNLAQCRVSPGNKAIEAAMCIEALLGGKDEKEGLAHKYSLRAALLLGDTYERRADIRATVKALYSYRSKIVHGSDPVTTSIDKRTPHELVEAGINICGDLIRKFVTLGTKPNWEQVELNSGLSAASDAHARGHTQPL